MPNLAPYKIKKDGTKYKVVNNAGMTKATFDSEAKALAYMRALYGQVPGAAKKADKTKWTGKAPKPAKAEAAAKPITMGDGKFPIGSQSDANDAWKLRRHSKDHSEEEVKAHISRAVQKLGLKHPASSEKSNLGFVLPAETLARLRENYGGVEVEEAKKKPKAGKHHYVGPASLKPAIVGYGPGACVACGQPKNDPDHDGDVDNGTGADTDNDTKAITAAKEPKPSPAADAQREIIKQNKLKPQASQPHPFAKSTSPIDGAHRCLMCGNTEPPNDSGTCNPVDINGSFTPGVMPQRPGVPVAAGWQPSQTFTVNTLNGLASQRAYTSVTSLTERVPPPAVSQPNWAPDHPAFVTEMNGKTLITAQATVDPALFERAFTPNEYFLWTQGRLVGADQANRNGAFWTSGDLELGQATVKHGPLNWLHEGKHVIGTLAEAAFTTPDKEQADAGGFAQPHIAVVGPIWRWIYPDEAEVVQMASEANKFWYSMECISKTVQCVGDGSCGAEAAYLDYIQGKGGTCTHMQERSATRRFADPTFLGAAVIVPPVRPGWADANAGVMTKAAEIAEKSFDQAGRPDVSATEWEQLMAQVVRFATA